MQDCASWSAEAARGSLVVALAVFLARSSLPAVLRGTAGVRADLERAPHLVTWALLAGGLWAAANTLTVYAVRDVGLAIAFPLWNSYGRRTKPLARPSERLGRAAIPSSSHLKTPVRAG